jgi:hypothetical protein
MWKIGRLMLLFLVALTSAAQQKKPWQNKPCKQDPGWCGIIVTFNPPLDEGTLLLPNEVTVDVPLELHANKVIVSSYPRGTEVAGGPSELLTAMSHFQKVGKYARFRGEIKKCPEEEDLMVYVYVKGFERYPITPYGSTIGCRPIGSKDTR